MTTFQFSQWLRTELAHRNLSIREAARTIGLDHSALSRILAGQSDPRFSTASDLCDALGYELRIERRTA